MSRAASYGIALVAALLVLPVIEAFFYFVVSGGSQSLRGGFEPGHVAKYVGIFAYAASLTVLVVAASAAVVLAVAKFTGRFDALFIVAASAPVAVIAAHVAALVLEPDDFPLPPGIWLIAALGGVIASGTFCAVARIPARRAPLENAPS